MKEVEGEFLDSVKDHRAADGSYRIPGEFVTVVGYRESNSRKKWEPVFPRNCDKED